MICAVIFDMDGVLIDTEKHYNAAWCQAATEAGFPFTREHALLLRSCEAKEGEKTTISLLEEGKISYVISTSKNAEENWSERDWLSMGWRRNREWKKHLDSCGQKA